MTFYGGLIVGMAAGALLALLTVCCLIMAGKADLKDQEIEEWHRNVEEWKKGRGK